MAEIIAKYYNNIEEFRRMGEFESDFTDLQQVVIFSFSVSGYFRVSESVGQKINLFTGQERVMKGLELILMLAREQICDKRES
jgi:hypothetical protein